MWLWLDNIDKQMIFSSRCWISLGPQFSNLTSLVLKRAIWFFTKYLNSSNLLFLALLSYIISIPPAPVKWTNFGGEIIFRFNKITCFALTLPLRKDSFQKNDFLLWEWKVILNFDICSRVLSWMHFSETLPICFSYNTLI